MKISFSLNNYSYEADSENPIDISIPLIFDGEQPNIYDADKASAEACEMGTFIGDTRRGGSCNFDQYKLIAHCNGTHTECVGHISDERLSIQKTLSDVFIPSVLISVTPENATDTNDTYNPEKKPEDQLITQSSLKHALGKKEKGFLQGVIIRTLPNDDSKKNRRYMKKQPPYFSLEAMKYISELSVKHLLLDIPSVDRTFDEGKLSAHHIFWNVRAGSHDVDKDKHSLNTITEMIYVPNDVKDGMYLLNIQIAPFVSDASPSRPVIFKITNLKN
jgi:kynurenine formamidase